MVVRLYYQIVILYYEIVQLFYLWTSYLMYSSKCQKMGTPICGLNRGILDRLAAVDHHSLADIDPDMCCAWRVIGILEKYQIPRPCFPGRDIGAVTAQTVCRCPRDTPAIPAMIDYPAYEA